MSRSQVRRRETLRSSVDARLAPIAKSFSDDWPVYLAGTAGAGIGVVVGMQLLEANSIGRGSPVPAWLGVGAGVAVAAGCLALLGWAYWRIRLDPRDAGPHVVILLSSVVTIGASVVAFSGVTTLALQGGLLTPGPGSAPDLWATEQYFLWNLMDAVPVLDVPGTLAWDEPRIFAGQASGGLLLLFTLVFISPLLQIAISGYRLTDRAWFAARERRRYRPRRRALLFVPSSADAWMSFGLLLFSSAVALATMVLLMNPSSSLRHLVSGWLVAGADLVGLHVPISWLLLGGEWLAVAGLVWLAIETLDEVYLIELLDLDSLRGVVGALLAYLCLPVLAVMVMAAATLALLHSGVAAVQRPIPPQDEVAATLVWYAWHVAAAVPGLDLSRTVGWSPAYEFVDRWTGAILLLCKLLLVIVLVVPVGRLIRIHLERVRRTAPAPAALDAAHSFAGLLRNLEAALDDVERLRRTHSPKTDHLEPGDLMSVGPGHREDVTVQVLADEARQTVEALESAMAEVRTLFGPGRVSESATAALLAAHDRLDAVNEVRWHTNWNSWPVDLGKLDEARAEAAGRADGYREAAAAALRAAGRRAARPSTPARHRPVRKPRAEARLIQGRRAHP